ncbi:MAG: hypothetical protein LUM44_12760 [Pyrinomonadaceae bacterium]|nr:hypothetical protein [Pyrinomonadaceae bacterium]
MRKVIKNAVIATAMLFSVFMLADNANAQGRRNAYTKASVDRIIRNVENRVDVFVRQFDRSLDNSRLDDRRREDVLNRKARNLESATDELRRDFDRRDRWIENKDEVRRCLNVAADINVAMRNNRFNRNIENNWRNVVFELNTLARVYNLPTIGSGVYR